MQTWNLDRELSNYLHQYLLEFIKPQTWQNLSFIAVAKGPGSFTSTRIGVVTARTIAQQLNIPLFAISSLGAFVFEQKNLFSVDQIVPVQMKATREQIYGGIYQLTSDGLKIHYPDTLMTSETWQQTLIKLDISNPIVETPTNLGVTVNSVLQLAYIEWQQGKPAKWSEALPFYG
jgi:tRNA threonylcarbamoyl adenosine modification protein YeaZ